MVWLDRPAGLLYLASKLTTRCVGVICKFWIKQCLYADLVSWWCGNAKKKRWVNEGNANRCSYFCIAVPCLALKPLIFNEILKAALINIHKFFTRIIYAIGFCSLYLRVCLCWCRHPCSSVSKSKRGLCMVDHCNEPGTQIIDIIATKDKPTI